MAIELKPQNATAYFNRGVAYHYLGAYEKAIKDFSKAIEMDPEDISAYRARGEAYAKLGQQYAAEADFCKADDLKAAQSE